MTRVTFVRQMPQSNEVWFSQKVTAALETVALDQISGKNWIVNVSAPDYVAEPSLK